MLAVKMHEDVVLTQEQGNYECGNMYSQEMISKVEADVLSKLDYRLNYATSLDFLIQILFVDQAPERTNLHKVEYSCSRRNLQKYNHIRELLQQCLPIIHLC